VLCWVFQVFSDARAAVTAAVTAPVTSIPGEEAPSAACRRELISMPLEEVDPSSVFNAEDELIGDALFWCQP
jgi:hypothetical protein